MDRLTPEDLDRLEALLDQPPGIETLQDLWTAAPALLRLARLGLAAEQRPTTTPCHECRHDTAFEDDCPWEQEPVIGFLREAEEAGFGWFMEDNTVRHPRGRCPAFAKKEPAND